MAKTEQWVSLQSDRIFVQSFGRVYGEGLKRVPRGFDKHHHCAEDLKRKTFFVRYEFDDELALSNELLGETARLFSAAGPFMQFITNAIGLRY